MTDWTDFLELFRIYKDDTKPGDIMIRFVNRYMQPVDGIRYLAKYEGKEIKGETTESNNTLIISPSSIQEIRLYAWSRKTGAFKLIETIRPILGKPQLIYETMKTYKQETTTKPHPPNAKKPTTKPVQRKPPAPGPSPTTDQGVLPKQDLDENGAAVQPSERKLPDKITAGQLKNIFPSCNNDFLEKVADECNRDLKKYKLDTILRRAHFFAQAREEAGSALKANSESLNYQVAGLSIFGYYKKNPTDAKKHGRIDNPKSTKKHPLPPIQAADQEAIGNHAYGNRTGSGNGGPETGDGWKYRGRGIFQLTFKTNYKAFDDGYKYKWDEEKPDFILNQ